MNMYVDVLVEIKAKQVDKTFTYLVPTKLQDKIKVGILVVVPFGKKKVEGYVLNIHHNIPDFETKMIIDIKNEEIVLNEELINLGYFLKEETLCSLSTCFNAMLPKALKAKSGNVVNKKYISYLSLVNKDGKFNLQQQKIIDLFKDNVEVLKKDAYLISESATKTLIKKGNIKEIKKEEYRYNLTNEEKDKPKKLNIEQQSAVDKISNYFNTSKTILLHGVTGSGKTEVYMHLIEKVLKQDKTALVLVPEISLTPQLILRFNKRFPKLIAVLHSHLSDGERFDEWRKIEKGECKIVIGARSAVFAPLKNLGIIILDEEHSDSYKQENNPKYQARKEAIKRSTYHNCPVILGSATPSLDSMARALKKRYEYVSITKRASGGDLPTISLVDMSEEAKNRHNILSRELEYKIIERLNKKEQVVLLLNRRGHSTIITCANCGFTYRCPYCDITLTYHKTNRHLRCHYCGYTKYVDDICPSCHEKSLNYYGLGTEKLEEYLKEVFPTAKVIRMDADTTTNKGVYEKIINDFQEGKYDILLGTQMVSKGLDFPNVSLVGIINADASLNIPEYKSNERSFALLTQASGRAGRSNIKGEVVIQTFNIMHPILKCVLNHNYQAYFNYEMKIRKTLKYPPYYYLVQIKLKSRDFNLVSSEIKKAKNYLEKNISKESIVLGPSPANPFLINGIYHYEILIKYRSDDKLIPALQELDKIYTIIPKVRLDIDLSY